MQKNQRIVALVTGGMAGTAAQFAAEAKCTTGHARNTLGWLVWKGLAQKSGIVYQRFIYKK